MVDRLRHTDVRKLVASAAEAGAVNLELPMGKFLDSMASALPEDGGEELSLHVLCCNEYFLVTGLVQTPIEVVRGQAGEIKSTLE